MIVSQVDAADLRKAALASEAAGQNSEALATAWLALDATPNDHATKFLVARLLRDMPDDITPSRQNQLWQLLKDPTLDPNFVAPAGWALLERRGEISFSAGAENFALMAQWLEGDAFARELLCQTYVTSLTIELKLTALRRWLLLSDQWRKFSLSVAALVAQAVHNQGAWPFGDEERICLDALGTAEIALAYGPLRPRSACSAHDADLVTQRVAEQYENWPYPCWSRVMVSQRTTVPELIAKLDPDGAFQPPLQAKILIAGCGTGREAAIWAMQFPDATIIAIDLSQSSLHYGMERCARAGLTNIVFRRLDLHRVSELGLSFDVIVCSGVLHHLPDPEKGWATLAQVLKPGGVMRVMLYSRVARLRILAARKIIADMNEREIDDDLLRAVRARLIEKASHLVCGSPDFYTLGGVCDLLMHCQEDPFDIPRIACALDQLKLALLAFVLPTRAHRSRYCEQNPGDGRMRNIAAWAKLEKDEPFLFSKMYDFWCQRSPG